MTPGLRRRIAGLALAAIALAASAAALAQASAQPAPQGARPAAALRHADGRAARQACAGSR